ncbi:MAG TPA: peptidoglycan editing factor PgeF [Tepidisphaeraceae bacterium]|nr:peptidoglycan editing factor PgeF [Tepidisphaeraceae bacterium]
MIKRLELDRGVVVYASTLLSELGVRHAFSTRIGGVSSTPFDSMNLGNPNGCEIQDESDRIATNYRMLQEAVGFVSGERVWVHQVHGKTVMRASADAPFDRSAKADAIVSDDPRRILSIRVADCVPVLLAGDGGRVVAAVHAGWRGVVAGVVPEALREMNVDPQSCVAAIGPSISMENFEIGPEVIANFKETMGERAPVSERENGKGHVDLRAAIALQLAKAGLSQSRIDVTDRCTFRDREEFFSHRRDRGITGRMAALIQCKSA